MSLLRQIASERVLHKAWKKVKANQGGAGVDGQTLLEFEQRLDANLHQLGRELAHEQYQPRKVRRVFVPKRSGDWRGLSIMTVRDRIAQRAAVDVLAPLWEPVFLPCSYGFRVGLGAQAAVGNVERLRAKGLTWVVDGDIKDCFDSLDHDLLMQAIRRRLSEPELLRLIRRWLSAGVTRDVHGGIASGAAQGGALSPLLCNIYLHSWDAAVTGQGLALVRYADDWLIPCASQQAARLALAQADKALGRVKLQLHPYKTRITTFADGFSFLGAFFLADRTHWLSWDADGNPAPGYQSSHRGSAKDRAHSPLAGRKQAFGSAMQSPPTPGNAAERHLVARLFSRLWRLRK